MLLNTYILIFFQKGVTLHTHGQKYIYMVQGSVGGNFELVSIFVVLEVEFVVIYIENIY